MPRVLPHTLTTRKANGTLSQSMGDAKQECAQKPRSFACLAAPLILRNCPGDRPLASVEEGSVFHIRLHMKDRP